MNKNISIIWDFDGTLTPMDSTGQTVEALGKDSSEEFWEEIKKLRGDKKINWEHVLASDTPIWMYTLSRIAHKNRVPLNKEFFKRFVAPKIKLYPRVCEFLKKIKNIQTSNDFKKQKIKIYHFIVSAGLKELIEGLFPEKLIDWTFGGRYTVIYSDESKKDEPESIPAFCMDETMKTRSIFEIAKGAFLNPQTPVNKRIRPDKLKFPFPNMIYIGDGPTDIPALSLVKSRGGLGVILYDKEKDIEKTKKKLQEMSLDNRADLITPADFSLNSELFHFIRAHCQKILHAYKARDIESIHK